MASSRLLRRAHEGARADLELEVRAIRHVERVACRERGIHASRHPGLGAGAEERDLAVGEGEARRRASEAERFGFVERDRRSG